MVFPFEMPADKRQAFLAAVRRLRLGQTPNDVVELVGPPDIQYEISAKEHNRPLGSRFIYYLKKKDDGVNEAFDQSVTLDFDIHDALRDASIHNLPDFADQIRNLPVTASNWKARE